MPNEDGRPRAIRTHLGEHVFAGVQLTSVFAASPTAAQPAITCITLRL